MGEDLKIRRIRPMESGIVKISAPKSMLVKSSGVSEGMALATIMSRMMIIILKTMMVSRLAQVVHLKIPTSATKGRKNPVNIITNRLDLSPEVSKGLGLLNKAVNRVSSVKYTIASLRRITPRRTAE